MLRERGVYSLLRVSGAPLMRVWGISRTSGAQNLHFDAKINIACASLGRKSHKRSDLPLHAEDIVVNDFGEGTAVSGSYINSGSINDLQNTTDYQLK